MIEHHRMMELQETLQIHRVLTPRVVLKIILNEIIEMKKKRKLQIVYICMIPQAIVVDIRIERRESIASLHQLYLPHLQLLEY